MRRTAVFDLDGTLADTSADLIAATNASLLPEGLPLLDVATDGAVALSGGRAMLREGLRRAGLADEERVDRLYPVLLRHYETGIAVETRLFDGVAGCLEGLLARDWALGVCTNKPVRLAEILLQRLGIRRVFAAVLGSDSLAVRKPDPLHLTETIRLCGGVPGRSVLVGDSETDRVTARNGGVKCVLVTFGPGANAVKSLEPEAFLDHFDSLPDLLGRMIPP